MTQKKIDEFIPFKIMSKNHWVTKYKLKKIMRPKNKIPKTLM